MPRNSSEIAAEAPWCSQIALLASFHFGFALNPVLVFLGKYLIETGYTIGIIRSPSIVFVIS